MAAYFQDDHADALRNDPAITAAVGKKALASQPTLSRFYNRLDEKTLTQLEEILRTIRKTAYAVEMPEHVIFDLDSTLFATFGKQEGGVFNFHYQANGYHPLICFDGITGDLLKIELRPGSQYCCNGAAEFMRPLLEEYQERYPNTALFLRDDSGFATDELYRVCEDNGTSYVIRLKENDILRKLAKELDDELYEQTQTREDAVSHFTKEGGHE